MIGTSLNQYQITAAIGAGGMGEVFRARDTRLNRDAGVIETVGRIAHGLEFRLQAPEGGKDARTSHLIESSPLAA